MPSTMDLIRFSKFYMSLRTADRNKFITDTVTWLEAEERPKVRPEHLSFLVDLENALQSTLNVASVDQAYCMKLFSTYGSFPFFDKFVRRSMA
jgi:hypothetical protein